jgi:hypothetical protein
MNPCFFAICASIFSLATNISLLKVQTPEREHGPCSQFTVFETVSIISSTHVDMQDFTCVSWLTAPNCVRSQIEGERQILPSTNGLTHFRSAAAC